MQEGSSVFHSKDKNTIFTKCTGEYEQVTSIVPTPIYNDFIVSAFLNYVFIIHRSTFVFIHEIYI